MDHRIRAILFLVVAACLPGCGKDSVRKRLAGTWTLDRKATKALPHFQNMPSAKRQRALESIDGMKLTFMFTERTMDFEAVVPGIERAFKVNEGGTYRVVNKSGSRAVLVVAIGDGESKRIGVDVEADRLVIEMDGSPSVLRRK